MEVTLKDTYSTVYTKNYYENVCAHGEYGDTDTYEPFYANIARNLVDIYQPKTVLDVGCAIGYLVKALRDLGVDAYGVDASEYAVRSVPDEMRAYCYLGNVVHGLPKELQQKFDLVINIEVAEHIYEEDVPVYLDNLCTCSDVIVFSSSPTDFEDKTHVNVQQIEYWSKKFAQRGFYRDLLADVTFISPQAVIFERREVSREKLVEEYERTGRLLQQMAQQDREKWEQLYLGMERDLFTQSKEINRLGNTLETTNKALISQVATKENELNYYRGAYNQIIHSSSWYVTKPFRWIKRKISKIPPAATALPQGSTEVPGAQASQISLENYINTEFSNLHKLNIIHTQQAGKRLNLVTDSIGAESLLGGVATALILASLYANAYGMSLRIITRHYSANPMDYERILKLNNIQPVADVSYYCDSDRAEDGSFVTKLEVGEDDFFFATSWWSAYAIRKTFPAKRFFYIIQEVETFFYPHGDLHLLCSQIMQDANIDFIVNSHYLWEYFKENEPQLVLRGTWFEPAFSKQLYSPKTFGTKQKYRLFFYARPNNPRNLYVFGLTILKQAIEAGILDTQEWEILLAGSSLPDVELCEGVVAKSMGLMSWQEYGAFLSQTDLAVSLMYTPHPSYPPYDAAMSGCVVLSNTCLNKTQFPYCDNVILAELSTEPFLKAFEQAVVLAKNPSARKKNYENMTIPTDWGKTLEQTVEVMGEWQK